MYFLQTLDFVASALTVISGFVAAGYIIAKGARIIYKEIRYEEKNTPVTNERLNETAITMRWKQTSLLIMQELHLSETYARNTE